MDKLSVCMATRNGARFLQRQLETILSQLGPDDELVISDDSSTDATLEIIRDFKDERIRLLAGNTFYSPVYNFENALKRARGDVIVLADQDDIWLDGKIACIRAAMAASTEQYYLLVLNGQIVNEDGEMLQSSIFEQTGARNGFLKNLFDNTFMGCCMAFRRPLLELALPFPASLPMHDWWLGLLCELVGRVDFKPDLTIQYRRHGATVTDLVKRVRSMRQVTSRILMAYHVSVRIYRILCRTGKG